MMNPVICCIGYNRPNSMKRLLDSIGRAVYDDTNILLVISIDNSPESSKVEEVASNFEWKYGKKEIIRHPQRLGLKKHCLQCGDLSIKYGSVIFLEDDVVVSPGFYRYVKSAASFYSGDERVIGISLYAEKWVQDLSLEFVPAHNGYDTFFTQRELSHGQCWLGESWLKFKKWYDIHESKLPSYNKKVPPCVYSWNSETSWSKYISHFMAENDLYYVCPYHSFATNMSEVGVHARSTTDICQVPLSTGTNSDFKFVLFSNAIVYDAFYERKDEFVDVINNIPYCDICFDLNGAKYDYSDYKYLLTINSLPYKKIKEFGVNMDPVENNIIYNVQGTGIYLYEIPINYSPSLKVVSSSGVINSDARTSHILNKIPSKMLFSNLRGRLRRRIGWL